jgi:hypothetical protein
MTPDGLPEPIAVAVLVTGILEELGIAYLVGGSLASSVHGEPRSTNDVDIVADLDSRAVSRLIEALGSAFYVSTEAALDAVRFQGSFNAIHMTTAVKVDVYVAGTDEFNRERLRLRQRVQLIEEPPAELFVDTAEHSVLRKLEWYRRGGEVSERQWRDVVAVLRIQRGRVDRERLEQWAARLGVSDLLVRALGEVEDRP